MRAKFQVLIIPYQRVGKNIIYGVFRRTSSHIWQFVSGGGEEEESREDAAVRELFEELEIRCNEDELLLLDTCCSIPVNVFKEVYRVAWGEKCYVIQEHTYGLNCEKHKEFKLSDEHDLYIWGTYEEIYDLLHYDSNKTALYELNARLSISQ